MLLSLPKSISEVHPVLKIIEKHTYKGENFLLYNDTENIVYILLQNQVYNIYFPEIK